MTRTLAHYVKPAGIIFAALVMSVITSLSGLVPVSASGVRQQHFAEASAEFGVPQEVLLAVSFNQSRWENHAGMPSIGGGYGLMHLTTAQTKPEDGRGDPSRPAVPREREAPNFTLDAAAALLDVPPDTLKNDDRQNVRAAAAMMLQFAKEDNTGKLPASLSSWYGAVKRMSGMTS